MTTHAGSAAYASGEYFHDPRRHSEDAAFKARQFLAVFNRAFGATPPGIEAYVDVGSGSGDAARLVAKGLAAAGCPLRSARGYDVSPHVAALPGGDVEFVHGDFSQADDRADLVTLFDVIEHVPGTLDFLQAVARRGRIVGLHIPLDDSWNTSLRDMFRRKVRNPGHLVFLNAVSALNLVAMAGLQVIDYEYTFGFEAPSGSASTLAKLARPLRVAMARTSPWLMSRTLGGASLMVVALTSSGADLLTSGGLVTQ